MGRIGPRVLTRPWLIPLRMDLQFEVTSESWLRHHNTSFGLGTEILIVVRVVPAATAGPFMSSQ